MTACLGRLVCQRQVRMRRSGNMNYVEPVVGEHAIKIGVPMRHGVANRKLFSQDRLKIANGQHTRTAELLNFLDVPVSDFPAANNTYIQHQSLSTPTPTASIWPVSAATTGSRPCPIASIARYICHAVAK